MKILSKISKILTFVILTMVLGTNTIYAQTDDTENLVLYVSDSCEHCETLLEVFEEQDLLQYVTVKEVSSDANLADFRQVVSQCNTRAAVPLLFDGTDCHQGQFGIKEIVYPIAGLEVEDPTPSYEEKQVLSGEEDPGTIATENEAQELTIPTESNREQVESTANALSEVLGSSMDGNNGKPIHISIPTILIAFIAPAMFLTIAYLLLSKMKV